MKGRVQIQGKHIRTISKGGNNLGKENLSHKNMGSLFIVESKTVNTNTGIQLYRFEIHTGPWSVYV